MGGGGRGEGQGAGPSLGRRRRRRRNSLEDRPRAAQQFAKSRLAAARLRLRPGGAGPRGSRGCCILGHAPQPLVDARAAPRAAVRGAGGLERPHPNLRLWGPPAREERAARLGEPRAWCDGAVGFAAPPTPDTRRLCVLQNVAALSASRPPHPPPLRTLAAVSATSGLQPPTPHPRDPVARLRFARTPAAVSVSSRLQPPDCAPRTPGSGHLRLRAPGTPAAVSAIPPGFCHCCLAPQTQTPAAVPASPRIQPLLRARRGARLRPPSLRPPPPPRGAPAAVPVPASARSCPSARPASARASAGR